MNPELQDEVFQLLQDIEAGKVKIWYTEQPYDEASYDWTFTTETGWKIQLWKDADIEISEEDQWGSIAKVWRANGCYHPRSDLYPETDSGMHVYEDEQWGDHPLHHWRPTNLAIWRNAPRFTEMAKVAQIVRTNAET